jgi:hypothetical protein
MKNTLFMAFFLIIVAIIYPDDNIITERSPFTLELSVSENEYMELEIPQSPYVFNDNFIRLFSGEKIFVEADVVDDIIVKFTVVKEITDQSKTVIMEFSQIKDDNNSRKHKFMMLKIINPFDKKLEYKAAVYFARYNKWDDTSTIPVRAKLTSYESWPDILLSIVLYDFVLMSIPKETLDE